MSLETPTTKEVNDNFIANMEASLNQTIPQTDKSFIRVLMKTIAAVYIMLYKYAGFIFQQVFVCTATILETEINGKLISPLIAWGELIGVGKPTSATNAQLLVEFDVINQVGQLPAQTQLIGTSNQVVYLTLASVPLDAATKTVEVIAASDPSGGDGSGVIGNLDPGAAITFVNALTNVSREAVVDSQTVTAANAEATEVYRQRVKDRFQKRPQGGAYADYELWGEEVAGIVNVYPYTSDCPGQVDVYVEATEASSGSPDGIPTDAQLEAVRDAIFFDVNGLNSRRPAGALVNTFAIIRSGFSVTVNGLDVSDAGQVQADITEGVSEYFLQREPYIIGLSIPPRRDRITNSAVAGLVEDIVSAAGGIFSNVVVKLLTEFIPSSTYSGNAFSVNTQEADPQGLVWNPDGSQFFVIGDGAEIFEYTVPTAYDLSSGVLYSGNSFDVSTEEPAPKAMRFNQDGTKFFIVGDGGEVFAYNVETPYDFSSTITVSGSSFDVSTQEPAPTGLDFSTDGKKFFIIGGNQEVFEYTVSNGFDLSSTVAFSGNSYDASLFITTPTALHFTDNGGKFYIIDGSDANVREFEMTVPYGFGNTVNYNDIFFDVSSEETAPTAIYFTPDKTKFFIVGTADDEVLEYDSGTTEVTIDTYTLGEGEKAKSLGVSFVA